MTTAEGIAREWSVTSLPSAQRAALADWLSQRAAERERAERSHKVADALARAAEQSIGASDSVLPDRASLALPIAPGVHVQPVFGQGESFAPLWGDRTPGEAANPDSIDAWGYLADNAMGATFMARVFSVMREEADEHGRRMDVSKIDDVASDARMRFVDMVTDLMTRDDVVRIDGYSLGRIDPGDARDTLAGVGEFLVPRLARCNACQGCTLARERQSAGRASRWNVKGCDAPVTVIDAVTPNRLLTRAIWRSAADPTLATGAVYATRAKYFRSNLVTEVQNDHDVNLNGGDDPLRYAPEDAANLVRFLVTALDAIGEADNAVVTKGLSPIARGILTRVMSTADTVQGAKTALARARALWPNEHGTIRDARERERAERTRAREERRNASKRERRALAALAASQDAAQDALQDA